MYFGCKSDKNQHFHNRIVKSPLNKTQTDNTHPFFKKVAVPLRPQTQILTILRCLQFTRG